jgi:hypothetical protein
MLVVEDERRADLEDVTARAGPADQDPALAEAVDGARRDVGSGQLNADEQPASPHLDDLRVVDLSQRGE